MAEALKNVDFSTTLEGVKTLVADPSRVFTVPVWGWTGDGKTCSILTLFHYADPVFHGLGLSFADDGEELAEALGGVPEYRDLPLTEIARSTADRLTGLSEVFVDDGDWPPGTDAPTPYLLRVRGVRATYGYVFMPDLQGGAYRANDATAQLVLQHAHGCAVMVDPGRYSAREVDSKRYRDAVDGRVQRCVEKGLPVAVMITKADSLPPDNSSEIDQTHMRLTRIIEGADKAKVFRISIAGVDCQPNSEDPELPPEAVKRSPDQLIAAWMWLLTTALETPAEQVRQRPPELRLAAAKEHLKNLRALKEVREIGVFSGIAGSLAIPMGMSRKSADFLLLEGDNLFGLNVFGTGEAPERRNLGLATGVGELEEPQAQLVSGEVYLGEAWEAQRLWLGRAGDALEKVSLPFKLEAWAPVGKGRIAGVDDAGRIHLLSRNGNQFEQQAYVGDFIEPISGFRCVVNSKQNTLLVCNGRSVEAIRIAATSFGERLIAPLGVDYESDDTVVLTEAGTALVVPASGGDPADGSPTPTLWTPEGDLELPSAASDVYLVAVHGDRVAWLTNDGVLNVAVADQGKLIPASRSASVDGEAIVLTWDSEGASLLLLLAGDRCATYQVLGFADVQ